MTSVASRGAAAAATREHARIGGITAHQQRRVLGRDVEGGIDPRRSPCSPGHTRAGEEAPVIGIRGVQRREVDARTPDDVRHPQRRIAGDRALQDDRDAPSAGSRSGPPRYRYE